MNFDPHLSGMKEHGVLMTFNPYQEDSSERKGQEVLEYWVVGYVEVFNPYISVLKYLA